MLSMAKIMERSSEDTFYMDLLLWFVLPTEFGSEALGDLNEEYEVRRSTYESRKALAWYRRQVRDSIKACFLERLERIAVIGTIIDLLIKFLNSFRK
jgi:hypothetical protein